MPRRSAVVATLATMLLSAAPAGATVGLGLRAGFLDRQDAQGRPTSGGMFVRAHSGFFGLEAGVDRWTFDRADGADVTTTPVTLGVLLYPVPFAYVLGGGGLYDASITDAPPGLDGDSSELSWLLGAGLEVPVVPALRLTGDVRYGYVDRERSRLAELGLDDRSWVVVHVGAMFALPVGP